MFGSASWGDGGNTDPNTTKSSSGNPQYHGYQIIDGCFSIEPGAIPLDPPATGTPASGYTSARAQTAFCTWPSL